MSIENICTENSNNSNNKRNKIKKNKNRINLRVHRLYDWLLLLTTVVSFMAALELFNFVLTVNAKQVVISEDNMRLTYETSHKDVATFLKANDITLGERDRVNVSLDEEVHDGMFIEIIRAVNVKLNINGKEKTVLTSVNTVEELLKQENIAKEDIDEIKPSLSTKIREGLEITINKYTEKVITETKEIPYNTIYKNVSTIDNGKEKLETEGKNGIASVTYKVRYLGDTEVSRQETDYVVLTKATDEVILKGITKTFTSPEGKNYKVKEIITMNSSAYTNSLYDTGKEPGDPLYGITRSGMETKKGVVAVDPDVIPLMSRLYVEGYGEAIAADTGSAIVGNKIDLFFDTRDEALNYGRRDIKVYVLE